MRLTLKTVKKANSKPKSKPKKAVVDKKALKISKNYNDISEYKLSDVDDEGFKKVYINGVDVYKITI